MQLANKVDKVVPFSLIRKTLIVLNIPRKMIFFQFCNYLGIEPANPV